MAFQQGNFFSALGNVAKHIHGCFGKKRAMRLVNRIQVLEARASRQQEEDENYYNRLKNEVKIPLEVDIRKLESLSVRLPLERGMIYVF